MDSFNYGALQVRDLGELENGGKVKVITETGATHWMTITAGQLRRITAVLMEERNECTGHHDDDHSLMSGAGTGEPTFCDGTCTT